MYSYSVVTCVYYLTSLPGYCTALLMSVAASPSSILKPFVPTYPGPDLYYYEVIECGRRILLTGVLIFIAPQSATQPAMACIFAFASLLGFELMRPHMDPADSWLYRLVSWKL